MTNVDAGEEEAIRMIMQQFVARGIRVIRSLFSPDGEFVSPHRIRGQKAGMR
jgi:hypothetical protein